MMYSLRAIRLGRGLDALPAPAAVPAFQPLHGSVVRGQGFRTDHDDTIRYQQAVRVDAGERGGWQIQHIMLRPDGDGGVLHSIENQGAPGTFAEAVQRLAAFEGLQVGIGAAPVAGQDRRALGMLHYAAFCLREGLVVDRSGLPHAMRPDGTVLDAGFYDEAVLQAVREGLPLQAALAERASVRVPVMPQRPDWVRRDGRAEWCDSADALAKSCAKYTTEQVMERVASAARSGDLDDFQAATALIQHRLGRALPPSTLDALLQAATNNSSAGASIAGALLHMGASLERLAGEGADVVGACAQRSNPRLAAMLLVAGARPSTQAHLDSLLAESVLRGSTTEVDVLLAAGAQVPQGTVSHWNLKPAVAHSLLAAGFPPEKIVGEKDRPLLFDGAVRRNDNQRALIDVMLAHGADVDFCDAQGQSVLAEAVLNADWPFAEKLLMHGAATSCRSTDAATLFELMLLQDAPGKLVALAVQQTPTADLRGMALGGEPLLHALAARGMTRAVRMVLAQAPELLEDEDGIGRTPLQVALAADRDDTAAMLLQAGADPLHSDRLGEDALSLLGASRAVQTAVALLEPGRPHAEATARALSLAAGSPLHWAIAAESEMAVERVLSFDPQSAVRPVPGREPVLPVAQRQGLLPIVRRLLEIPGIDVDAADKDGCTATIWAVRRQQMEAVYRMARMGADLDRTDRSGQSALAWAHLREDRSAMINLLNHGADPHVCTQGTWWQLEVLHRGGPDSMFLAHRMDAPPARAAIAAPVPAAIAPALRSPAPRP